MKNSAEERILYNGSEKTLEGVLKFAEADEEQGGGNAQNRSVHEVLEDSSTNATQLFAASVEVQGTFLVLQYPCSPCKTREDDLLRDNLLFRGSHKLQK